jgi:dihydroxyacetone kinase-like predicted kinase
VASQVGSVRALEFLDAAAIRRWADGVGVLLRQHRCEIDELNVYPVPDADTGTNLVLTWDSVTQNLAEVAPGEDSGLAPTMAALSRGALLGARGNSGVILSQVLRGMAEVLGPLTVARGGDLQDALARAAQSAYSAVAEPVEGTVLTVLREAAAAASRADGSDLGAVVRAALRRSTEALQETPGQLAVLARAGVVDAGARGLVLVLQALCGVVTGDAPVDAGDISHLPGPVPARPPLPAHVDRALHADAVSGHGVGPAYEVQYLLEAQDEAVALLRSQLALLGDSLVVTGGEGLWNVHVHVDDVGAALERGVQAGRPSRITVTRFADDERSPAQAVLPAPRSALTAEVVLAVGPQDTAAGPCEAGQALALVQGQVTFVADRSSDAAVHAVERLLAAGATLLVLSPGAAATAELVSAVLSHVEEQHPGVTVEVVDGGQPHHELMLAAS